MKLKKTNQANLEKRKGTFFQLGLVIVLSLVLIAFEWTSTGLSKNEFDIGASRCRRRDYPNNSPRTT